MRVLFTGTRTFRSFAFLKKAIENFEARYGKITHALIGGDENGLDGMAWRWARLNRVDRSVIDAQWDTQGKKAGPIRNSRMVSFGKEIHVEHCIAVWDGKSDGTADTMAKARRAGVSVHCYTFDHPAQSELGVLSDTPGIQETSKEGSRTDPPEGCLL